MSNWRDQAACVGLDPDIFFPRTGDISGIEQARQICSGCPVAAECLNEAMTVEHGTCKDSRAGVFGGLSSSQRYNLYRSTTTGPDKSRTGGRPISPCGTYGAYLRHHRYGEKPCSECQAAARQRSQKRRDRLAAAA